MARLHQNVFLCKYVSSNYYLGTMYKYYILNILIIKIQEDNNIILVEYRYNKFRVNYLQYNCTGTNISIILKYFDISN